MEAEVIQMGPDEHSMESVSKSVPLLTCSLLPSGSKTAFFLLDQQVTTPACLLVQPDVLVFLFMAL